MCWKLYRADTHFLNATMLKKLLSQSLIPSHYLLMEFLKNNYFCTEFCCCSKFLFKFYLTIMSLSIIIKKLETTIRFIFVCFKCIFALTGLLSLAIIKFCFFKLFPYIKPFHFCLEAFSIICLHLAFLFLDLFPQKEN